MKNLVLSLFVLAAGCAHASPLDACNASRQATTLLAAATQSPKPGYDKPLASAVWADAKHLAWAAPPGSAKVVLAHSARGQLAVLADGRLTGADGTAPLEKLSRSTAVAKTLPWIFKGKTPAPQAFRTTLSAASLQRLHRSQVWVVALDAAGKVLAQSSTQAALALDDLYAAAEKASKLGSTTSKTGSSFALWAPTAQQVGLCLHAPQSDKAAQYLPLKRNAATGIWQLASPKPLDLHSYTYLVDVFVPGLGLVRNRVTDPYSVALTANSERSVVLNLADPRWAPSDWANRAQLPHASRVKSSTDMVIYELHVRDFSVTDNTVPAEQRGKYAAFTQANSNGMKHLRSLSQAGMTDVHMLPIFDIATIPELGCTQPVVPSAPPDSTTQQASVAAGKGADCFNWGYDPFHYTAPEGSYATDPANPGLRIKELREMVLALNREGLRVGMDVVYNHTPSAGQDSKSVLDRIVPNYYQRLNAQGGVETSTCCANTATEHKMMAKLMQDSALVWATQHGIDSFRFDLMGHQPRAVMARIQLALNQAVGKPVQLIGEGWNFGEVENGARFVQASQLSLNGSGIGTFSDRARDAVRGGSWADDSAGLLANQGWANGLHFDPTPTAPKTSAVDLAAKADMVRVGLAGSLRNVHLRNHLGATQPLADVKYGNSPAGYASQPSEVVNYVDNHDNPTLFDINAFKMPQTTSAEDRARAQVVGIAVTALSQGIAYFHAGVETLRSKSLDRNSYDSGDWFNRIDWTLQDNHFGTGLPIEADNGNNWAVMKPILANPQIKPAPEHIRFTRDATLDLLRIRASSKLFRMDTAADVDKRLKFHNTGPEQVASVVVVELDGVGLPQANFSRIVYAINADKVAQTIATGLKGTSLRLHPVHLSPSAADKRALQASFDAATGSFTLPARSAVVWVLP